MYFAGILTWQTLFLCKTNMYVHPLRLVELRYLIWRDWLFYLVNRGCLTNNNFWPFPISFRCYSYTDNKYVQVVGWTLCSLNNVRNYYRLFRFGSVHVHMSNLIGVLSPMYCSNSQGNIMEIIWNQCHVNLRREDKYFRKYSVKIFW